MASEFKSEFESLDDEVKELLLNYKHKKATTYEPCTLQNFKECLIGLSEELGQYNINYIFNPHTDLKGNSLELDALVKLINSVWMLLHYHKNLSEKSKGLLEQNHALEHHNKQLRGLVDRLKEKINSEKNESKACVASAQRIADRSDDMYQKLTESKGKLVQIKKQKEASEKSLKNEISRLKLQNEKLLDRLRNKGASCSQTCDLTLLQMKEREKQQQMIISQLQKNNQELLHEVIGLKEDILSSGLSDLQLHTNK
ncbi:hypothetical protein K1T71_003338 [Dendrolimus kikuchii]|uniref:Uncharacterized protein n=1 Tax=Dendrolimus kikuchii TaxID=765133 RepID=A0ACC1DBC2_9NEOP|nr:hypothetical protein K1T71_003338 [Dendrolimus kikuchii]